MTLGTIVDRRRGSYRIRPDPDIYGQGPDVIALWPEEDVLPLAARVEYVPSGLPTLNHPGGAYFVTIIQVWVLLWVPLV